MGARGLAQRSRGVLRRPTAGEAVEHLLGLGLGVVVGVGAVVMGVTGSPPLWWAVAAVMVLVVARGVSGPREPPTKVPWGAGVHPSRSHGPFPHGAAAGSTDYSGFGGGGLEGGGGGGDGGGC